MQAEVCVVVLVSAANLAAVVEVVLHAWLNIDAQFGQRFHLEAHTGTYATLGAAFFHT